MNTENPLPIIRIATVLFMVLWGAYERISAIVKGRRHAQAPDSDRKSLGLLYASILLGYGFGIPLAFTGYGAVPSSLGFVSWGGLVLIASGLVIRLIAIRTLAEQFTYTVKIVDNHRLITSGIYRHIRHPSYLGQALIFLGCGMALANWISLLLLFVPVIPATLYRIAVEERVLKEHFPDQYADYAGRTGLLIPRVH